MFCYRRFGHNEGDEPLLLNLLMYKKIKSHHNSLKYILEKLVNEDLFLKKKRIKKVSHFKSILKKNLRLKNYKPELKMVRWSFGQDLILKPEKTEEE